MGNDNVLKQDLKNRANPPGIVFIMHLLFEEKCNLPDKELIQSVMEKHLGEVYCFSYDEKMVGLAPGKYKTHFEKENKDIPPQLMMTNCLEIEQPLMDEVAKSQLWDCPESEEIFESCKYQIFANDVLGAGLVYKDRAEMLTHYVEALLELFPTCKAVLFETSKKMLVRDRIINCEIPYESRFIYYAVNVRFFNIQGTNDMLVDTLGMSTLFLPDLQYHFHGMDPNAVVNHAYNVLSYIYDNDNPIKSGDHIDGIKDGKMSMDIQWRVQYEDSLIQPIRDVLDINMGEYASGAR